LADFISHLILFNFTVIREKETYHVNRQCEPSLIQYERPLASEATPYPQPPNYTDLNLVFAIRGWLTFPKYVQDNDLALKDIIGKVEDKKHSRDQVQKLFSFWLTTGRVASVPRIPLELIEKLLREQCGDVVSLIA
jgi:hypothetical protein